jgi:hypothetical protein
MGAAVRGTARRIGWIGASSRAAAGLVLVYLAVLGGDFSWNLDRRDVAVGMALFRTPAAGAALFYGVSLLVGAWRRQPDCEATILSNWLLRRDDQVGCPIFTPIDLAEERLRRRRGHASVRARAREG